MIRFESVCLTFQSRDIFSNFNFTVFENEKILIQGKSGVGKTTLFKLLLGFEIINKGNIFVNNSKINKTNIHSIRKQIFYLSQDIDLRQETISILIQEILKANSIKQKDSKLKELLIFLELDSKLLKQEMKDLSGGERQRIGLLLCFLLNRPIWLLDEPTSALDDAMKNKIAGYICDQDKTIMIISHDDIWKKQKNIKSQIKRQIKIQGLS